MACQVSQTTWLLVVCPVLLMPWSLPHPPSTARLPFVSFSPRVFFLRMPYGLFRAWKTDVDALYLDFLEFRTNYSSALGQLMTEFMAGNIEFSQLAQITTDFYDSPWNPFDLARVVEQQTDTIRNLMALLSEFRQAGIITARHLADFFSWTFDSRYDRVYALVVVGNHPNQVSSVHCGVPEPAWVTKAHQANPTHKAPHALHVSSPCVCPSVCVCCLFIRLILVVNRRT